MGVLGSGQPAWDVWPVVLTQLPQSVYAQLDTPLLCPALLCCASGRRAATPRSSCSSTSTTGCAASTATR